MNNCFTEGLVKLKYKNVINIQLKLWELVHPDIRITIFSNIDDISIHMKKGLYTKTFLIKTLTWNDSTADKNYQLLQKIFNNLYEEFIIEYYKLMTRDYLWEK